MNVKVIPKTEVTSLLNDWHQEIRFRNYTKSQELKKEIDNKIHHMEEDQSVLLYYSLLDYRYKAFTEDFSTGLHLTKDNFQAIESFGSPTNDLLNYYYYFFKASNETALGNYRYAGKLYKQAEILLTQIPDEVEKADFYFKYAAYCYCIQQPLLVIKYTSKSEKIFSEQFGYDFNIACCKNMLGVAWISLKQFNQAETLIMEAIEILKRRNKKSEELILLRFHHNIGMLYAEKNQPIEAIKYFSKISTRIPNHFKSVFLEARERVKLKETEDAARLIERGLKICQELNNKQYKYHFNILQDLNENAPAKVLEKSVLDAFTYFEHEGLHEYVREYAETLAIRFHEEGNYSKASNYFYLVHKKREKQFQKGR